MAFTRLEFQKHWTSAEDFPTYQSDESKVREDMQYHPNALRDFVNALIDEMEAKGAASSIGATSENGAVLTVQSFLNILSDDVAAVKEDIETLAAGGVPATAQSVEVSFTEESWVRSKLTDPWTMTILPEDHKRMRSAFGSEIYHLVDNEFRNSTWGTATTKVTYNDSNGNITLSSESPYSGKIVFFGL